MLSVTYAGKDGITKRLRNLAEVQREAEEGHSKSKWPLKHWKHLHSYCSISKVPHYPYNLPLFALSNITVFLMLYQIYGDLKNIFVIFGNFPWQAYTSLITRKIHILKVAVCMMSEYKGKMWNSILQSLRRVDF